MPTSQSGSKSASPKVRKFARELGANVVEIPGSQREVVEFLRKMLKIL